ncbi:lipoprotein, putative [Citrifermentans bemidjiense Bem]|uniref:Lipoprotein, putative n=1 Tax=Citrifermentans bemidjiense (strain ATCC BAA-1014 / DSM 16622 / JCM 12645 / Bem) TaxID=404380 RepID=B5ECW8_CITBB|nr:hypothetical protein [Citrifermentans bemidjiense]ACH40585.1 lipoprotein, putative [Citrifermentans bemidjiense Bem]
MSPRYGLILLLLLLSGCTEFNGAKAYLLPPSALGMEELAPRVFVNKEMSLAQREDFRQVVAVARTNITNFYGSITSQPDILACSTEECFAGIGGGKPRGKDLGKSKVLISPRGLTVPILTHEWSHAELRTRMDAKFDGIFGMNSIPTWFDEGLAVVVSEEPRHSEKVWERIVAQKMDTPRLDDLVTLKGWNKAAGKYGDVDCALGVPGKMYVVYTLAGHEVRTWHRKAGREGLLKLIDKVKSGESFENSYAATSK